MKINAMVMIVTINILLLFYFLFLNFLISYFLFPHFLISYFSFPHFSFSACFITTPSWAEPDRAKSYSMPMYALQTLNKSC